MKDRIRRQLNRFGWDLGPKASLWRALHLLIPTISGVGVAAALLVALEFGFVGQLSDVLDPDSAAEAYRPMQFIFWGHHWTVDWWVKLVVVLVIWGVALLLVLRINISLLERDQVLARLASAVPKIGKVRNGLRRTAEHLVLGISPPGVPGRSRNWTYIRVITTTWLLYSLPPLVDIGFHTLMRWLDPARLLDPHGLAMLCALSLVVLLGMTITLWILGMYVCVGFWIKTLPFLPFLVFAAALFSGSSLTEGGKGILNGGRSRPGGERLMPSPRLLTSRHDAQTGASEGPLVILCSSGGGSRAALFTAGILSRLWWQEENATASQWREALAHLPAGQKQILFQGPHFYPGRLLLARAQILSSVSGGSLASAYFQDSLYRLMAARPPGPSPLLDRSIALARFFDPAPSDEQRPPVTLYSTPFNTPSHPPTSLQSLFALGYSLPLETLNTDVPALSAGQWQTFETNPFINAMRQDHLAATASGFFMPWIGRGPSIEAFWSHRFRWYEGSPESTGLEPRRLSRLADMEQNGRLPALVLNSTLSRTGSRVAITNLSPRDFKELPKYGPPVDRLDLGEPGLFKAPPGATTTSDRDSAQQESRANRAEQRFDPLPGQIVLLSELDPWWDIPLVTAAHASANFPYGFPLMRLYRRDTRPTIDGQPNPHLGETLTYQGHDDVLELSDGGIIDNTALDSAMAFLRANRKNLAQANRKVLIFQIDSGELPVNRGADSLGLLFHQKTEADNALWRANLDNQANLHSIYLDELCALFGEQRDKLNPDRDTKLGGPDGPVAGWKGLRFAFYRVRPGEMADDHIMTSWHLDRMQRWKLYGLITNPNQGSAIREAAHWLLRRP